MTQTVIGDHEGEPRRVRHERAWAIFQYVRDPQRTGLNLTIAEVKEALHIKSERGFSEALCEARKIALKHGELITFCSADSLDGESSQVFRHLMSDAENDKYFAGTATRARSVTGQTVNLVGHLEWGAENACDPLIRQWSRSNATAYSMVVTMADEMAKMASAIYEERRNRKSENQSDVAE